MTKYYVISTIYVGPNHTEASYADADTIEISTRPPTVNGLPLTCVNSWCGESDGWSVTGHGEYETLDEARAAVFEMFSTVRSSGASGADFEADDPDVVAVYKPGKFELVTHDAASEWFYEAICDDVNASTTDEQIDALLGDYEAEANGMGCTLPEIVREWMEQRRTAAKKDEADQ